jgi:hypothetical protein
VYILGKDNGRVDALSRRSDYIKTKEIFNYSILKKNADGTLSPNVYEFNIIQVVVEDPIEEFLDGSKIRLLDERQEQDYIERYYNGLL